MPDAILPTPDELRLYDEMCSARLLEAERELCESSLIEFMRLAWPHIGESGEFIVSWHHEQIAADLEALARGEIRDEIFNIPPRMTKSLMCSVAFPAWIWAQPEDRWSLLMGPHVKFLCVSYGATLAEDMAVKMRRLILGEWYQKLWGHQVKLHPDQASRSNFANLAGGERISCSIEGGILGRGGDIQICFPYDEIVWTERGPRPIGDLVERQERVRVWSFNRPEGKFELRPVVGWHRNPGRRLVRVVTERGSLRCTEDHRLLTDRGYVEARLLRLADRLVAADHIGEMLCSPDLARGSGADSITSGNLDQGAGGLGDGSYDIGCYAGLSPPPRCIDRRSQVTPCATEPDVVDRADAYAVALSQDATSLSARRNLLDKRFGKMGRPIAKTAVPLAVGDILCAGAVFEAAERGLGAVAVDVPDLLPGRTGAEEGDCNQAVYLPVEGLALPGERDPRIAVDDRAGHQFPRHTPSALSGTEPRQASNSPHVRNLVSGEAFNRQPSLVRVERVEIVHDVPPATYCVTVEHNGNMVAGQCSITASNCDDPHHVKGAESDTQRRETIEGMRALTNRITDPRRSARIMVMQRLHVDDATNYALENWRPDVLHRWFPMRFDSTRPCPVDIREEDGDLLWPDVWTEEAVAQEERELGPYMASGQLAQAPVPRGGGIIKREWWRLWPDDAEQDAGFKAQYRCDFCQWSGERLQLESRIECPHCGRDAERRIIFPPTSFRLLTVDTGIGDREINSWSAATLWGVWHHGQTEAPRLMLMDAWRGRPVLRGGSTGQKGLVEIIASMANRRQVDTVLIEKKTRGVDLHNELARQLRDHPWSLEFFEPTGRGDKAARLSSVQPLFTNDLIWAPNKVWADLVITETCEAPFGRNDDLCDCCSMALIHLRDTNRLSMSHEHAAEVRRQMVFRPRAQRFNASAVFEGM